MSQSHIIGKEKQSQPTKRIDYPSAVAKQRSTNDGSSYANTTFFFSSQAAKEAHQPRAYVTLGAPNLGWFDGYVANVIAAGSTGVFHGVRTGYSMELPKDSMNAVDPLLAYWCTDANDMNRFGHEFPSMDVKGDRSSYRVYHLYECHFDGSGQTWGQVTLFGTGWDAFVFVPSKVQNANVEGVIEPTLVPPIKTDARVWIAIRPYTSFQISGEYDVGYGTHNSVGGQNDRKIGGKVAGNDAPTFTTHLLALFGATHLQHNCYICDRYYWTQINAEKVTADMSTQVYNDLTAAFINIDSFSDSSLFNSVVALLHDFQETDYKFSLGKTGYFVPAPHWVLSNARDSQTTIGSMFEPPQITYIRTGEGSGRFHIILDDGDDTYYTFNPGSFFPVADMKLKYSNVCGRQYWPSTAETEEKHEKSLKQVP